MRALNHKVFLLSPANASGVRAQMILNQSARFDLAQRLQREAAPIGELFSFVSGLYFRGKIAYAGAFAAPPERAPASLVITPARGLLPPETLVTLDEFRAMAEVPIDLDEPRYLAPLERDARLLAQSVGPDCAIVLLGSIATAKYMRPLLETFGDRLLFPSEFVGRGDMSRGGLMLRAAQSREELTYVSAATALRHGPRPPKLPKLR
jgi:hypothetical protein